MGDEYMMNKKGITTKDWVIVVLLFGGIFALGTVVIADYATTNSAPGMVSGSIASHYSTMQSSLNLINDTQNAVAQPGGLTLTGGLSIFATGVITVLSVVLGSMAMIPSTIMYVVSDFGIDTTTGYIFMSLITSGLVVLIIFAILNASKMAGRV
jgi:hypothetical protein